MARRSRTRLLLGLVIGLLLAAVGLLWWMQGPSESRVRKTVLTTVQEEAPASFLVTGTMDLHVSVRIDSSQYLTPDWLTFVLGQGSPAVLSMLEGRARTRVRVPGRVSYGFDVRSLDPEMISVDDEGMVTVQLPELSVHSIEPALSKMEVRSQTEGWMRVFSTEVPKEVRQRALAEVRQAFRTQAEARIGSASQPRINTARALERMLAPPLKAAGLASPRFRIEISDRLLRRPQATEGETFRSN